MASSLQRRLLTAALAVLGIGLAAHTLHGFGALPGSDALFQTWIYTGLMWGATAVLLARVVLVPHERGPWLFLVAELVLWCVADFIYYLHFEPMDEPPFPNVTDWLFLGSYLLAYVGLVALLRARLRPFRASLWLDGIVGGLTLAALAAALMFEPVLTATEGDTKTVAVTLAYPVADLLLLCCVGIALALTGWRPGRAWTFIAASLLFTAVGDGLYSYMASADTYAAGSKIDSLWPASMIALAAAAWQPSRQDVVRAEGLTVWLAPAGFALLSLGLLFYGWIADLPLVAGLLAAAGLIAAVARAGLTLSENVSLLKGSREQALTDGLSRLGNRRRLMRDLEDVLASATEASPSSLLFFDLDGFKHYNDSFGHAAGDALLARLGGSVEASVKGHGAAYRLGGDEFCVLLHTAAEHGDPLVLSCAAALSEQGEGFSIGASCGVVAIPADAATSEAALQIGDERMYADKDTRKRTNRRQARDVLVQVLAERDPELRGHMLYVADLAQLTGRNLGLSHDSLDVLTRAAELHDIGKVAVPDDIIRKPGPLDDAEWRIMRQHTLVGERILAAAPALRPVADLVRSSHERWDGSGYPDALAGADIPVGARIIAVCDAYDAMTSDRPYAPTRTREQALAELRRCAGTQFDAPVVEAFCKCSAGVFERPATAAPA